MEGIHCIISNLVYQNIYFLVNFFFQSKNIGMLKLHMMISLTSQTPTESEVSIQGVGVKDILLLYNKIVYYNHHISKYYTTKNTFMRDRQLCCGFSGLAVHQLMRLNKKYNVTVNFTPSVKIYADRYLQSIETVLLPKRANKKVAQYQTTAGVIAP